jgi:D-lactate dehydrogenase
MLARFGRRALFLEMGPMKVAVFETEEWEHAACLRLQPEHVVTCTTAPLTLAGADEFADAEIVSSFVHSDLSARVLDRFPQLRMIATRSTGTDHIDLGHCQARGIIVSNVPDYGDATVAEHVFALLLALARDLVDAVEGTRRGCFGAGRRGLELRGKTLGVIGTGRIGRRVIEIARGFGMVVLAFDHEPDAGAAQRLGFGYAGFDEVLAASDILTLHVPATRETAGLLSDREFALMKRGAVLINTARGSVVDVAALVRVLADGRLRAAGLDVLPQEPLLREEALIFRDAGADGFDLKGLVANHVLLRFPNVIVTPHSAYNTDNAIQRIIETTLANIQAFARGKPNNLAAAG